MHNANFQRHLPRLLGRTRTGRTSRSFSSAHCVCRSPAVGAFLVQEHATQGALALVADVAANAVAGAAGLAKAALVGREDGYRAGVPTPTLL
jgi:hypothetical protein